MDVPWIQAYREAVRRAGIDAVGIVPAGKAITFDVYSDYISDGVPPQLSYLVKNRECHRDLEAILPGAMSVICCACILPEYPADVPIPGAFARFCAIGDYHAVMRERLSALREFLSARLELGPSRICVDSAPVLEREYAVRAGMGTIGFNHQVIHPVLGSHIALAELIVSCDLTGYGDILSFNTGKYVPGALVPGQIGCCRPGARCCVRACPTGALSENGYDFSRCLSYWSTQHRGEIPEIYARAMTSLWGCDRCQNACPRAHNNLAIPCADQGNPLFSMTYDDILNLGVRALKRRLAGSAVADIHPGMIVRNACILIGNRRLVQYRAPVEKIAREHGCDWVRQSAVRACRMLDEKVRDISALSDIADNGNE